MVTSPAAILLLHPSTAVMNLENLTPSSFRIAADGRRESKMLSWSKNTEQVFKKQSSSSAVAFPTVGGVKGDQGFARNTGIHSLARVVPVYERWGLWVIMKAARLRRKLYIQRPPG